MPANGRSACVRSPCFRTLTATGHADELVDLLVQDHGLKLSQQFLRLANEQAQPGCRRNIGCVLDHSDVITLEGCTPSPSIHVWIEMRMWVSGSLGRQSTLSLTDFPPAFGHSRIPAGSATSILPQVFNVFAHACFLWAGKPSMTSCTGLSRSLTCQARYLRFPLCRHQTRPAQQTEAWPREVRRPLPGSRVWGQLAHQAA